MQVGRLWADRSQGLTRGCGNERSQLVCCTRRRCRQRWCSRRFTPTCHRLRVLPSLLPLILSHKHSHRSPVCSLVVPPRLPAYRRRRCVCAGLRFAACSLPPPGGGERGVHFQDFFPAVLPAACVQQHCPTNDTMSTPPRCKSFVVCVEPPGCAAHRKGRCSRLCSMKEHTPSQLPPLPLPPSAATKLHRAVSTGIDRKTASPKMRQAAMPLCRLLM